MSTNNTHQNGTHPNRIQLIRQQIAADFRRSDNVNPSLLLQKGLYEVAGASDKSGIEKSGIEKTAHLKKMAELPASREYKNAFNRWFELTRDPNRFQCSTFTLDTRMLLGLTSNGILETGCSLSRNYGMPYIPGSSIKGAVRAWATQYLSAYSAELEALFGTADSEQVERVAGSVTFHDAWWVPHEKCKPFVLDVVTTHHQAYYNGNQELPSDKDNPIPNHLLAVEGSFYCVLEGEPEATALCQTLMAKALAENGIGAKTAAGYGYMTDDTKLMEKLFEEYRERSMTEDEKFASQIQQLTERQLIEMFSKDLKKTQAREDFERFLSIVREHRSDQINSWASVTKQSSKNCYKAYRFLSGSKD